MKKPTRKDVLQWLKSAGAQGDKATFTRLYVEHRISLQAASEAWREGVKFAEFIHARDEAAQVNNTQNAQ